MQLKQAAGLLQNHTWKSMQLNVDSHLCLHEVLAATKIFVCMQSWLQPRSSEVSHDLKLYATHEPWLCVYADLLADLTASQLLAQADLAECNSPLKILQIGGDDLFEPDEGTGTDYLLDTEAGLSPYA